MKRVPLFAAAATSSLAALFAAPAVAAGKPVHCDLNEFRNGLAERQSDLVIGLDDERQQAELGEGQVAVIVRYTDLYVTGFLASTGMVFHLDRANGMYSASVLDNTGWSAVGVCEPG